MTVGAALFTLTSDSMQFEDNAMRSECMVIEVRAFDLIFYYRRYFFHRI